MSQLATKWLFLPLIWMSCVANKGSISLQYKVLDCWTRQTLGENADELNPSPSSGDPRALTERGGAHRVGCQRHLPSWTAVTPPRLAHTHVYMWMCSARLIKFRASKTFDISIATHGQRNRLLGPRELWSFRFQSRLEQPQNAGLGSTNTQFVLQGLH